MARVTKQQNAKHFQKALKLSCWNSNMIRDMNNDNKFSVYFNDQVEYKRFHPGISGDSSNPKGGTVDNDPGRDDLSWLYAVGDLRTGYNHQYGFEHGSSDPYGAADANRLGVGSGSNGTDSRNNNRLRQNDEIDYRHSYTAGAADITNPVVADPLIGTSQGIKVEDLNHSVRPNQKWSFRKWGYQSDNVERYESGGYDDHTVVYHFGHHDNKDNEANRPNMRFAANNAYVDETDVATEEKRNRINMIKHEFDFHGFKDDWRYSLRMGGCLYEAARWVYDESSFHRTGRLTYTDDTLFMDDPFNPRDGTDIFGAHEYAAHTGMEGTTADPNFAYYTTIQANSIQAASSAYNAYDGSTCSNTAHTGTTGGQVAGACDQKVTDMATAYEALIMCLYQNDGTTDNTSDCTGAAATVTTCSASGKAIHSTGNCHTKYNTFITERDEVYTTTGPAGCFYDDTAGNVSNGNCSAASPANSGTLSDLVMSPIDEVNAYMTLIEQQAIAKQNLLNFTGQLGTYADEFTSTGHDTIFGTTNNSWSNAGSTNNAANAYVHGDCNGSSCESMNVATPSSGGVFADVHWVHVFNAHIFPLQDVGYYQYDQTLGIDNVNVNNDSITSRDGYGYNIYTAPGSNKHMVLRDVWGVANTTTYMDTENNEPLPNAASTVTIEADEFHSQYGTINIGNVAGQSGYLNTQRPNNSSDDFVPILTKTRRKIEDFNVVMANPTYEGHGFLNFVATYHDHTENYNDTYGSGNDASGYWIRQVGKRFLSTIGGLTTASNKQRLVCRAVKDGIDSYRMNGYIPTSIGTQHENPATTAVNPGYVGEHQSGAAATWSGLGHDDPFLAPLGPGPAGNYGNGQRCGAAMYENFGDWFLRPAQTYSAYNNFNDVNASGNAAGVGWASADCTGPSDTLCLKGMESYNYWAFILSEGYHPIWGTDGSATQEYMSEHELWRNGSLHYDRRGSAGSTSSANHSRSSGRGFAISSFPHNELGKDFRFNIRTLHNMGNGVAKQYYQIQDLTSSTGNEYTAANTQAEVFNTLRTSNLRTSETVWSYYFYAVDTIKIAFPEFVARVNHCDRHSHRNTSHCTSILTLDTENGNPDTAGASDGINKSSAYPGYANGHPHRRLGFQDIIIDGVTMKKTDNQYDSRQTRTGDDDWHKQYNFARGLRGDDHTRATLHYLDTEFANEDKSLDEANGTNAAHQMCGTDYYQNETINMDKAIRFFGANDSTLDNAGDPNHYQGYSDSYQPLKPCASWCALDVYATDVAGGFGEDPSRQTLNSDTPPKVTNHSSTVAANTKLSRYGGICGRVLRIDGLLQTYDELHNRQYGTIQEIWVQLQYAYQESLDNSVRTLAATPINKVQSPFPNVFFSAPEVVDIRGFCPSSNMKCRGYLSDQHQPYGGSRNHVERVHWNARTSSWNEEKAFGANQLKTGGQGSGWGAKQSGNDWTMDRDYRGDSKWPWNYHSYKSADTDGVKYGGGEPGTKYNDRDYNYNQYVKDNVP